MVERATVDDPVAAELIEELNADIMATHAEGNHFWRLTADDVAPGNGAFVVLRLEGEPIGCGAVRRLSADEAELKRMYVRPEARGRKIGAVLVDVLEAEARALTVKRLLLETAEYLKPACGCTSGPGSSRSRVRGVHRLGRQLLHGQDFDVTALTAER